MEPEGSLLCSQQPSIGPYPEPDESSPQSPTLFPEDLVQYYPAIYAQVFWVGLFFLGFLTKTLYSSSLPRVLHYPPISSSLI